MENIVQHDASIPPQNTSRDPRTWHRVLEASSSLQTKVTALVVGLTLGVAAIVSGYLVKSSIDLKRAEQNQEIVQLASAFAKAVGQVMTGKDPVALQELVADSANGMPLLYVIVSDVEGRELASAEHGQGGILQRILGERHRSTQTTGAPVAYAGPEDTRIFLEVTFPVSHREAAQTASRSTKLLGYVRTGMVANSWHRIMSGKLDFVIGIGILAATAAVPLGSMMVRRLITPLESLSDTMLKFSRGDLSVRSPIRRRDEIGFLAGAFNRMADQLQQTHERVLRLNTDLEDRVSRRTQQLRELAAREPLTGLFNRRHLNEMLDTRFAEAKRYGTDLSCIMIDLDAFKQANDTHGHHVGDDLLVMTASTIAGQLRAPDIASRIGGDEFVILLPQSNVESARTLAERIVERFNAELHDRFPHIPLSLSIGIASLHSTAVESSEALLRAADAALYQSKTSGRNRISVASDVSNPAPV